MLYRTLKRRRKAYKCLLWIKGIKGISYFTYRVWNTAHYLQFLEYCVTIESLTTMKTLAVLEFYSNSKCKQYSTITITLQKKTATFPNWRRMQTSLGKILNTHRCAQVETVVNNISAVPCLFDYTAFAVSGKVRDMKTRLTTPVGWLLLLQLTLLSRSAIVV